MVRQGVHQHFDGQNPGYVRRRCLPLIAWRTGDQAIKASGLDYRGIATYLVEGVTWARLKLIATRETRLGASRFSRKAVISTGRSSALRRLP